MIKYNANETDRRGLRFLCLRKMAATLAVEVSVSHAAGQLPSHLTAQPNKPVWMQQGLDGSELSKGG
jgi:hypothetical protein